MYNTSEEITKGIVYNKLSEISGYPKTQDEELNGVIWYKEDSYKNSQNDKLIEIFKRASKSQKEDSKGTPDFIVMKKDSSCVIVIECKADVKFQSRFENMNDYVGDGYSNSPEDTKKYAIDGALWYAQFLNDNYDVIAIACSGQSKTNLHVTSFLLPRKAQKENVFLIENCGYFDGIKSINDYEQDTNIVLGRYNKQKEEILKNLRAYTLKPGHVPNNKVFIWKNIKLSDEALAEAYIDTDYSKLSDNDFILTLKKYALFKYMDENAILEVE